MPVLNYLDPHLYSANRAPLPPPVLLNPSNSIGFNRKPRVTLTIDESNANISASISGSSFQITVAFSLSLKLHIFSTPFKWNNPNDHEIQ